MRIVGGDAGGIAFHFDTVQKSRLRFIVYQDSHYDLTIGTGPFQSTLLAKGDSSFINPGLDTQNVLTVIDRGDTVYLYANAHLLQVVSVAGSNAPAYGRIGLIAYDYALYTDVAFSNESVWVL